LFESLSEAPNSNKSFGYRDMHISAKLESGWL